MTREISTHTNGEVDSYLRKPYARIIIPEDDGSFRGEIMEFPGCIASGDDAASTLNSLEDAAMGWLLAALENGQPIPRPLDTENDFSGKLVLRIARSLHKKAAWYAEREGVSLNQFIAYSLAESVGERRRTTNVTLRVMNLRELRSATLRNMTSVTTLGGPQDRGFVPVSLNGG